MKMLNDPAVQSTLFKAGMDLTSAGIAAGSLLGYLPPLAAALTVIWTVIQIIDWWKTRKRKHHHKH